MYAWQLAFSEAAAAKTQFIEKEQMLIGLLRAMDLPEQTGDENEAIKLLRNDFTPLQETLSACNIDRVKLRRRIRALVSKGTYEHTEKVIHRSPECKKCFTQAEVKAQMYKTQAITAIHLLEAMLEIPGDIILQAFSSLKINPDELRKITHKAAKGEKLVIKKKDDKQEPVPSFLESYGTDLTALAREGMLEPLIGRRDELLRTIRTLSRKTKNNPLLIGDAGVGKTAIVRGLAFRIAEGNIVPALQKKRIIEVQMGSLIAGTKYRGAFEEKLVGILSEVQRDKNIILFIDEIHTIMGAGKTDGTAMDAAQIMKPALAQGDIRCIGATTIDEFQKHIEKDPALERRFQPIMVEEPSEEDTIKILNGLKPRYEAHHHVVIDPVAIEVAVKLSVKYLPERRLPDKALDLIDEACTRVGITNISFHGNIKDSQPQTLTVTEDIIAAVIADWTGCAVAALKDTERSRLTEIEAVLKKRVIGQDEAVIKVAQAVKQARVNLKNLKRPLGVFLFLGPSGVGKTELAKALAAFLFDSEEHILRFDMSEYKEKQSVAKLIGAPPGYAGYDEEGQLTGKLRKKPYSVVLFDEIEKAHPEVLDVFLQLFDEGRITDAKGKTADGRNAIFIMTSNIGTDRLGQRSIGFGAAEGKNDVKELISDSLKEYLRPEFINRIDEIIIFNNLSPDNIASITHKLLSELQERLTAQGIAISVTQEAINYLCKEGFSLEYGARPLARAIEQLIVAPLADKIVREEIKKGCKVKIGYAGSDILFTFD